MISEAKIQRMGLVVKVLSIDENEITSVTSEMYKENKAMKKTTIVKTKL